MSRKTATPAKKRGRRRLLTFLLAISFGGLAGGFLTFANYVDGLRSPDALPDVDGIVVWTGPGGGRLETAGRMLEDGHGERLLVSGVNPSLTQDKVADLAGLSEERRLCCLDVDYAALDTRGNARETASWAKALDYDHVILVTSAYHMPRARVEIAQEIGGLRVTPVPVQSSDRTIWWRDGGRFRRLLGEYGKYLLSLARGRAGGEETREPVIPNAG
jgi:uncharacterized SAM-binding protein YcdF (DUF218 family)